MNPYALIIIGAAAIVGGICRDVPEIMLWLPGVALIIRGFWKLPVDDPRPGYIDTRREP
jgi:hypothetical protein